MKSVAGLAACVAVGAAAFAGTPTGCPDFEVELPRATGSAVIRATDFGFSETNDHNAAAINAALAEAKRVGACRVELAPGTYRCFDGPGVQIEDLEDFTFDGKGATLVFRRDHAPLATQAELLENEGNVEVKNCARTVKPCRDAVCDILVERNTFVNPPGLLLTSENASRVTFRDNAVEWREPVFRRLPCAGQVRIQE